MLTEYDIRWIGEAFPDLEPKIREDLLQMEMNSLSDLVYHIVFTAEDSGVVVWGSDDPGFVEAEYQDPLSWHKTTVQEIENNID